MAKADIRWAFAMARFAYKLDLTEEEDELVLPLTQLIMEVLTLHNDYYSWEKEDAFYHSSEDKLPMANAVTLYMKWYSLSLEDAKAAIKAKAIEKEEKYLLAKEEFLSRDPPPATTRWLEIMEHMVAGNLIWSLTCPRYHKKSSNQYVDYYMMRYGQGYAFPDDCTRLETFVGFQVRKEVEDTGMNGHLQPNGVNKDDTYIGHTGRKANTCPEDLTVYSDESLAPLDEKVIKNPSNYIMSLPSKRLREKLIRSLNQWYQASEKTVQTIESAVGLLHSSSLMLDDIQDQSQLRRGMPATHVIYGSAQTMNSAYFLCMDALQKIYSLSPEAVPIYIEELQRLHLGQAQELYWTYHTIVPSEVDHIRMIDGSSYHLIKVRLGLTYASETTGLFRMAARLLQSEATTHRTLDISKFITLLGRHFQLRDDYQNLVAPEYTNNKGFCDDFDEGKISFSVIHALQEGDPELESIFEQRKRSGHFTYEVKQWILDKLRQKGSLEYTLSVVRELYGALWRELEDLEGVTGRKNWMLRMLLQRLKV
ncbi:hypothetical protein EYZ11_004937 [Aspergillus tanneri]|uniref:Geranylgeranyl pyrophosphate synthase n=1 Tax=Aspergillus tanneri TaxID=1220188 RepID=A0A4S3JJS7_9EURO|nr:hypothetical protein EYZ11_004937 [Aspergillus tanneri]